MTRTGGGQRQAKFDDDLARIQEEIIRSGDTSLLTIDQRAEEEIATLERERKAKLKDIVDQQDEYVRSNGLRGISAVEAEQLKAAQNELTSQKQAVVEWQRRHDVEQDRYEAERDLASFEIDHLRLRESLTFTAEERYKVQSDILEANQRERRIALQNALLEEGISDAKKASIQAMLDALPGTERGEREQLRQGREPVQTARSIAGDIRGERDLAGDTAEMYAEIDRLRQEDRINEEEAARAKAEINARYNEQRLAHAQSFFGTLAQLAGSENKKLAAIGKAAAIAQATIDGVLAVQKALASAPPPINFALAAAVGAVAAVNVAQIAGMKDGGLVRGPGGPRDDKVPVRLSAGEFVVNAQATAQNRAMLEALNGGRMPRFATGGMVGLGGPVPAMRGGGSITYAPTIDARGADAAAVSRLEAAMATSQRNFKRDVREVVNRGLATGRVGSPVWA